MKVRLRGRAANGAYWTAIVTNRVDTRDPLKEPIGIITAYRS